MPAKSTCLTSPLSELDDVTVIRAYQAGNNNAGAELCRRHDRFLRMLVFRKYGRGLRLGMDGEDLMQLVRLGLLHAAKEFDFREVHFLTPAFWWVRSAIEHYKRSGACRVFGLPRRHIQILNKVSRAEKSNTLYEALEAAFDQGLISKEVYARIGYVVSGVGSLDDPELAERAGALSDGCPSAEDQIDRAQVAAEVRAALSELELDAREQAVVKGRLMIDEEEGDGLTLKEIGQQFDLSREYVRQIELRVVRKLRKRLVHLAPGGSRVQ